MSVTTQKVLQFGQERQSIVIFDDFAPSPKDLIEDAAMQSYGRVGEHYPGLRAQLHPRMRERFLDRVMPVAQTVFGVAPVPALVETCYSIVTTPPAELTPTQRLPHFDSTDPNRLALLHYLSPEEQGGTAFYRHRATGFESVSQDRLARYAAVIDREIVEQGVPEADYIRGSTPQFEQTLNVAARFNRAILYRGNTIHCADIPPGMALPADPYCGRLTINTFLYCEDAA
jgi:hypothetical protein